MTLALWPHDLSAMPLPAWGGLAYVGLISQYFAFFVFNAAMAMSGVARVGQLMLLQPFVIIALATLVNRRADPTFYVGICRCSGSNGVYRPTDVCSAKVDFQDLADGALQMSAGVRARCELREAGRFVGRSGV